MKILLFICAFVWLSIAAGGMFYLARYESTPNETEIFHPLNYPAESAVQPSEQYPTLLFFAHPKCPCTRASLRELSRLMTDAGGKLQVYVIFTKPENAEPGWEQTDLRRAAEAIPNVRVVIDENERETKLFNARTSGLTLLYDRKGLLRFEGGITAGRGHEGDNAGKSAVFEIITADAEKAIETPVYGCPLRSKDCPETAAESNR